MSRFHCSNFSLSAPSSLFSVDVTVLLCGAEDKESPSTKPMPMRVCLVMV